MTRSMLAAKRESKHTPEALIRLFRLAAEFRQKCKEAGFADNAGAIHSAERVLAMLGPRLVHPGMGHLNNYRKFDGAIFSEQARAAYDKGERVVIEHVAPHRALTALAIDKIQAGASDEEFAEFVRSMFKIVLLTPEEAVRLNKINRTKIDPERLAKAGITLASN